MTASSQRSGQPAERPRTLGDIVVDYLHDQHEALLAADVELRDDLAAVHHTRVAARRYRSVLRVFADLFEPDPATRLDAELGWYAGLLGAARDAEVLRDHFADTVQSLSDPAVTDRVAARIDERLRAEQSAAHRSLCQDMRGERYLTLLAQLEAWNQWPPFTAVADGPPDAIGAYLDRARHTLTARLRRALRHDDDGLLHRARKAAKRARYAGEAAVSVIGEPAQRTVRWATALQEVLGEHHDAVVASAVLLELGAAGDQDAFALGTLYERELHRADAARDRARAVRRTG